MQFSEVFEFVKAFYDGNGVFKEIVVMEGLNQRLLRLEKANFLKNLH